MICPICERQLEIIERGGNIFEDDPSSITRYAVCRDCRKQWKLKNAVGSNQKKKKTSSEKQIKVVGESWQTPSPDLATLVNATKETSSSKNQALPEEDSQNPAKSIASGEGENRPRKKRKGALPKEEGRSQRSREASRDSDERPKSRSHPPSRDKLDRPKGKPQPSSQADFKPPRGKQRSPSPRDRSKDPGKTSLREGASKPRSQKGHPSHNRERRQSDRSHFQHSKVVFKPIRMGLAILSILAFLYFCFQGYFTYYLEYVRLLRAIPISTTVAVFVLGLFCLIAGIFLLLTLNRDGTIPFIVPSFLYLIGGVIAFFFRADSRLLLSGAIVALIVAIVLIILVLLDRMRNIEEE